MATANDQVSGKLEQLLALSGRLAEATTETAIAHAITSSGIAALGGAYGGMWLRDGDKPQLRMLAVSELPNGGAERWTTVPLDADAPLPQVVRTGEPQFFHSLADFRARFPASFERIRDTVASADVSYAMLPLVADGAALGALAITYDRADAIGAGERTYLEILARQCALALRRIELLERERAARIEAEEATRAREEILSVVSHDLRNPLGTILMGVTTLQQLIDPRDSKGDKMRTIAERIQRQSERMARLIEDLVDFAGIQAGRLSIERRPTRPEKLLKQTGELFAPIAQERGVGFAIEVASDLPDLDVDPERTVQLLANLVANALKVTSKGGHVTIGAVAGDPIVLFVRDSGPGIDAAELPLLFERYWRSKKAAYKGAGLGLSIARGIVEAHGGRIWAESQIGVGTTFYFTLSPDAR